MLLREIVQAVMQHSTTLGHVDCGATRVCSANVSRISSLSKGRCFRRFSNCFEHLKRKITLAQGTNPSALCNRPRFYHIVTLASCNDSSTKSQSGTRTRANARKPCSSLTTRARNSVSDKSDGGSESFILTNIRSEPSNLPHPEKNLSKRALARNRCGLHR